MIKSRLFSFLLRGDDMRTQMENIQRLCVQTQRVRKFGASFLSEGAGARTATEIVGERTKSDTWLKGQIQLNAPKLTNF